MTDSTDNARGPVRVWAFEDEPGGIPRSGIWIDEQSECPPDAWEYRLHRADLATQPDPMADPRVVALYEALYEIRDMLWSRPDISDRLRPLMGFAEEATNQKAAAALAAFDTTGGKVDGR